MARARVTALAIRDTRMGEESGMSSISCCGGKERADPDGRKRKAAREYSQ
jgi:hypothetical protein